MDGKGCPMDSFKTAFRAVSPSLPFVPEGLIDNKRCPMEFFNTAYSHACASHLFIPKGLIESKVHPMDSFNTALVLLVHPFPLSLRH